MPCEYSDIIVSPQELRFEVEEGSQFIPPYQDIRLEKASHNLTPRWTAVADAGWVYYRPKSGEAPERIQVSTTTAIKEMAAGVYQAHLLLGADEGVAILPSKIVTITLEVKAKPVPPTPPPPEPPVPPPPEPGPQPPAPEPPPPAPEPPQENCSVRFWKWLLGLFRGN
jgi:DNA-binding transcriptional LysR family regulator